MDFINHTPNSRFYDDFLKEVSRIFALNCDIDNNEDTLLYYFDITKLSSEDLETTVKGLSFDRLWSDYKDQIFVINHDHEIWLSENHQNYKKEVVIKTPREQTRDAFFTAFFMF